MKNYFACILLACCALNLSAQSKFCVGMEGGGGISFKSPNVSNSLYSCYLAGATFQYDLSHLFSIRTGLSYEDKRTGHEVLINDENGNPLYDYNFVSSFDYLSIPLIVRISLGQKIKFMMNAGLNFGYLLEEETKDLNDNMSSVILTEYYNPFDLGLLLGVGAIIPLYEKISLSGELRNNLGLTDVDNNGVEGADKNYFNATYLLVGLNYKL